MTASKPDAVLIHVSEAPHAEGAYYLGWRELSRRVRLSAGKNAEETAARRQRGEAEFNAVNHGVVVVPEIGQNGHRPLARTVAEFIDGTKLAKAAQDPRARYRSTVDLPSS